MIAKKILGQSIHSGALFIISTASRLLLAVALGKGFTTQEYGVYSLIGAVVGTVASVLPLGVSNYYIREVPGLPTIQAVGIFKSIVGVYMLILMCVVGVALVLPGSIAPIASIVSLTEGSRLVLLIAGVLLLTDSLATEVGRYLYARREIETGNIVNLFQTSLWALLVFAAFLLHPAWLNLSFLLALWFAGSLAALTYGTWHVGLRQLWKAPFTPEIYLTAMRFGLPLMLSNTVVLVNWLGRFVIVKYHSVEALGVFTYNYNVILTIVAASAPLINPIEPYAIVAYNRGHQARSWYLLTTALRYRVMLVVPLLVVAVVWADELIALLARSDYSAGREVMALLAPIPVLMILGNTFERILFLERRTTLIGRCYVCAAAVQLGLYLILVPFNSYVGAGIAIDTGLVCLVVLLTYYARRPEVSVRSALGRAGIAAAPIVAIAWVLVPTVSHLQPFVLLVVVTVIVGAGYLGFAYLFGALPDSETRMLLGLLSAGGRQLLAFFTPGRLR